MHDLEQFFKLETSELEDGTPRVMGSSFNDLCVLQLTGSEDNLSNITLLIGATQDPERNQENVILAGKLLTNIFPNWKSGQWFIDSIQKLNNASTKKSKTHIEVEDKLVTLKLHKEMGTFELGFRPIAKKEGASS